MVEPNKKNKRVSGNGSEKFKTTIKHFFDKMEI